MESQKHFLVLEYEADDILNVGNDKLESKYHKHKNSYS